MPPQGQNRVATQNAFRQMRPSETGIHSDMQESRMSSSRIRDDNFPVILEAKIQKQQKGEAYPAGDDSTNGGQPQQNPLNDVEQ